MAGPIKISILANARPAVAGMREVEHSAEGMGKKLGGVGKSIAAGFAAMGAAVVASGIVDGMKAVIGEAASLSAAIGTTKSIFGEAAAGMLAWSKTTATTLGLSQAEALNATKVFGGFFTGVGIGAQKAADMSKSWTTMAANMAAFGDIPVGEALQAVNGALIGEFDQIQRLIPTLSMASLQQKAMELSGKKNARALTDQDKAIALNAIMMDSLANKVGAAEREQQGYAVQMDRLKAQMKDAAAAIGGPFLSALTKGMGFVNDTAIPAIKGLVSGYGPKLKSFFADVGGFKPPKAVVDIAKSKEVTAIFDNLKSGLATLQPTFSEAFAKLSPIIGEIGAGIGDIFTTAAPKIQAVLGTIGTIVGQAFEYIRVLTESVTAAVQYIWQNFGTNILAYLSSAFSGVVGMLQGVFTTISGIFEVLIGILTGDWGRAWDGVKTIASGAWQFLVGLFTALKAQVTLLGQVMDAVLIGAWNAIKSAAISIWSSIVSALASAWAAIRSAIASGVSGVTSFVASGWAAVKSATSAAWEAVKSATSAAWNALRSLVSSAISGVKGAVSSGMSAVTSALSSAWNAAKAATAAAWAALKGAVTSGVSTVVGVVKGLGGKVQAAVSGAGSWLVSAGRNLIQGMINGIAAMAGALAAKARSVVSGAVDAAKGALGIASPSKKFLELGRLSVAGLIDGLETGRADIKRTVSSLIDDVVKAFPTSVKKTFPKGTKVSVIEKWKKQELAAGKKRQAKKNALLDRIESDNKKLQDLAAKRDTVADSLKAATEHVGELQQARAGVVASVADAFGATFKVISDAADAGAASIDDVLQRSRDAVAQATAFAEQLKGLAAKGVAPEILQELAMAGPKAGMDTARALMAGSADQLKELNDNYRAIADTGKAAGEVVAGHMYDTGIAAAKALAAGYASQQAYLEASILQMIADLNKKIADAVKAATPKKPPVETNKPIPVQKPKPVPKGRKGTPGKAVPAGPPITSAPVSVVVNTGVVVDKRGMVDAISSAFNEVSAALGRPIEMNVAS
jgi:phage-related protein